MVETAAKFKPKLVQTLAYNGEDTVTDWLNHIKTSRGDSWTGAIDPLLDELFLNISKEGGLSDSTSMIYMPSDVFNGYITIIENLVHNIVLGSNLPELFWSQLERSNYASAEIAAELGARFIRGVRQELSRAYHRLAADYCKCQGYIMGITPAPFSVRWKAFDLVGAAARASNFASYAGAIASLRGAKALTKETEFYFLKTFYPDAPENTAQEYENNLLQYANTIGAAESGEPTDAGWMV
jgi:hypothetical protein